MELYRRSCHVLVRWIVVGIVDDIIRVLSLIKRDFGVADKAEMIYAHADLLRESEKVERILRALTRRRNLSWWRSLNHCGDR